MGKTGTVEDQTISCQALGLTKPFCQCRQDRAGAEVGRAQSAGCKANMREAPAGLHPQACYLSTLEVERR